MARPLIVGAILIAGCCLIEGVHTTAITVPGYDDGDGNGFPPPAYQLGDTVQFVAAEIESNCPNPGTTTPSTDDPRAYTWSSGNEVVTREVARGRFAMTGLGETSIWVRAKHSTAIADVLVVPPVARLVVEPATARIAVGDTVTFHVTGSDEAGRAIRPLDRRAPNRLTRLVPASPDGSAIAGNIAAGDGIAFVYQGFERGTVTLQASLLVLGTQHLTATATLVVE